MLYNFFLFQCSTTTAVRKAGLGKRKRSQGEEEEGEDTKGQENICPNSSEKVTPQRRGRSNPRTGQTRLFQQEEKQSATRTPPNPKAKGKQQMKTPTQTGECVVKCTVNALFCVPVCILSILNSIRD